MGVGQLRRKREKALSSLRRGDGDREKAAATLLLADQALAGRGQDFDQRLASAKEAIGMTPSREQEQVQQEAAAVRLSMTGSGPEPDVARRAREIRAAMEGTERGEPFEGRLASAKAAIGRS